MLLSDLTNILVIDDNDTDLLIAKIVIEKAGFKGTIITKNSGKGALEYIGSVISTPEKWPSIVFFGHKYASG